MRKKPIFNRTSLLMYIDRSQELFLNQFTLTSREIWQKEFLIQCTFPKFEGKGKAVTLQAWSGPEGSRKLRFPDFTTTAQEGGKVVSLTHRPHLPPGNPRGTHFC